MPEHVLFVQSETAPFEIERDGKKSKIELLWGDQVRFDASPGSSGVATGRARGCTGKIDLKHLGGQSLLEFYFIDVGQGDGILVRTPDGRHILIDGGFVRSKQPSGKNAADFVDWKFRRDYGRDEIQLNAIIASHCDADHYGGIWDLLNPDQKRELGVKTVRVDAFFHAGVGWWQKPGAGGRSLGTVATSDGTQYLTTLLEDRAGMEAAFQSTKLRPQGEWGSFLRTVLDAKPTIKKIQRVSHATGYLPGYDPKPGSPSVRVLGPVEFDLQGQPAVQSLGGTSLNTNGNSVLLRVDYGRVRVLLTGDLNAAAQRVLLDQYAGQRAEFAADVAKACHHGSDDCSYEFLSTIAAGATIISSGDNEKHAHPRPAIVAASALTGHVRLDRDRVVTPLVYSTEIARSVRMGTVIAVEQNGADVLDKNSNATITYEEVSAGVLRPKKATMKWKNVKAVTGVVYGLVNVRTDGETILCATMNEEAAQWEVRSFESRF